MLWEVMGLASKREGAKISALEAKTNWKLEDAQGDIRELQHEIEQLNLMVKALATICQQNGVFTENQFKDLVDFIDIQDGVLDGKSKKEVQPRTCPKCNRQNQRLARKCMWCEADL
ncbi:MAG: hypothetical protein KF696_07390 [Planctomycetes bacterium]|nr:hypothetical protein [Planctomycetota bacterium]MCW8135374.1 hypothetical protein [Planctomycetota bacterium]